MPLDEGTRGRDPRSRKKKTTTRMTPSPDRSGAGPSVVLAPGARIAEQVMSAPPQPSPDVRDRAATTQRTNARRGARITGGPGTKETESAIRLASRVRAGKASVEQLQTQLRRAGFNIAIDGKWGPQTEAAYRTYTQRLAQAHAESTLAAPAISFGQDVKDRQDRTLAAADEEIHTSMQEFLRSQPVKQPWYKKWGLLAVTKRGAEWASEELAAPTIGSTQDFFESIPFIVEAKGDPFEAWKLNEANKDRQRTSMGYSELPAGVATLADRFVQDLYQSTVGAPAGLAMFVANPIEGAKMIWEDYKHRYGPLLEGDSEEFFKRQAEHPLFAVLDVAAAVNFGAKAGQAAGLVKKGHALRQLKVGEGYVQLYQPGSALGQVLARRMDAFSEKHPDLALVGANARGAAAIRNAGDRTLDELKVQTVPFQRAAKRLNAHERMAYDVLARYGPEDGAQFLQLEINKRVAASHDKEVPRAVRMAQKAQARALRQAAGAVLDPPDRLMRALVLGRELTEGPGISTEQMKFSLRMLDPETASARKNLWPQIFGDLPEVGWVKSRNEMYRHFRELYPEPVAQAYQALADSAALHWARETGGTPEDYYRTKISEERAQIDPAWADDPPPNVLFQLGPGGRVPGFYSQLERAIEGIGQPRMTAEQALAATKKAGVKDEEITWLGLDKFLEDKDSITKEELLAWVQDERLELEEEVYPDPEYSDFAQGAAGEYEKYTLPGGRDYRELLVLLPQDEFGFRYQSSHWETGNVLAHVRFKEREVDGVPALFIEEIQSDWHQDGRKKGYRDERAHKAARQKVEDAIQARNRYDIDVVSPASRELEEAKSAAFEAGKRVRANATGTEGTIIGGGYRGARFVRYDDAREQKFEVVPESVLDGMPGGWTYRHSNGDIHWDSWHTREEAEAAANLAREQASSQLTSFSEMTPLDPADIARIEKAKRANDEAIERREELHQSYLTALSDSRMSDRGVPDAPFKKSWHELSFKRMLRWAVDNGYTRVGWTSGAQQAERYQLSNHLRVLEYDPRRKVLRGWGPSQHPTESPMVIHTITEDQTLRDLVGAEIAERLEGRREYDPSMFDPADYEPVPYEEFAGPVEARRVTAGSIVRREGFWSNGQVDEVTPEWFVLLDENGNALNLETGATTRLALGDAVRWVIPKDEPALHRHEKILEAAVKPVRLEGEKDLRVGGHGMMYFYDKILPGFVDKYLKSHGVKTQTGKVDAPGPDIPMYVIRHEPQWEIYEDGLYYTTVDVESELAFYRGQGDRFEVAEMPGGWRAYAPDYDDAGVEFNTERAAQEWVRDVNDPGHPDRQGDSNSRAFAGGDVHYIDLPESASDMVANGQRLFQRERGVKQNVHYVREILKANPEARKAFERAYRTEPLDKLERGLFAAMRESPPELASELLGLLEKTHLYQRGPKFRIEVDEEAGKIRGVTEFVGGQARIGLDPEHANLSTPPHEIAHVVRRFLPEGALRRLEEILDVEDGVWKEAHEEKFAKMTEAYFYRGEAPNWQLRSTFATLRAGMRETYSKSPRPRGVSREEGQRLYSLLDEIFNPALALEAGDGAFFMPDVGSWRARGATSGRRKSLRQAKVKQMKNRGVLAGQGRIQRGPKVTLQEFNRTARLYENKLSIQQLEEFADDLDLDEFPETGGVPPGYGLFNPRGVDVPRIFRETPTTDDLLGRFPHEMAREFAQQRDELLVAAFPDDLEMIPEEYRKHAKVLPLQIIEAFTGDKVAIRMARSPRMDKLVGALDMTNALMKAALIYGKLSYIPLNLAGNMVFLTLAAGPFAGPALVRAARGIGGLDPELLAHIDFLVGEGAAAALALEDRNALERAVNKLAYAQSAVADRLPRRAAWIYQAARHGFISEGAIRKLLEGSDEVWQDGITYKQARFQISERAERDMVQFRGMSPFQQEVISRAIFIYGWIRGATKYGLHSAIERPLRTNIMLQLGQHEWDEFQDRFGQAVSYVDGITPVGKIQEMLGVETVPVRSTQAVNPVSTAGEALAAIYNTAKGDVKLAGPVISDYIAPGIKTPIEFIFGFNTFFMEPYDNRWEAITGPPQRFPAVRVGKQLISPEITDADVADQPVERQPNYIVPTERAAREEALWDLFLGNARKRNYNFKAGAARGREQRGEPKAYEDYREELIDRLEDAGLSRPPEVVFEELRKQVELDADPRLERGTSYNDKLQATAEVAGFKVPTDMPEAAAEKMYLALRRQMFKNLNTWENQADKLIDRQLEEE